MTPYWALQIHAHRNATTVLGNSHGSSDSDRISLAPGQRSFRTTAQAKPSRSVRAVPTPTNTIVRVHDANTGADAASLRSGSSAAATTAAPFGFGEAPSRRSPSTYG
jgi:hypothetical protein